jgi:RNA polymerase sigma factor (sigma-70 family)
VILDSYQDYDEAQLFQAIQIGSPYETAEAFQRLYDANDVQLRRYLAYSRGLQEFEIDEVCSVVWERALERIGAYTHTGVPYVAWLRKTAGFVILERSRQRRQDSSRTEPILDEFDIEDSSDWGKDPLLQLLETEEEEEAAQRRKEIQEVIRQLVKRLPQDHQDVIVARNDLGLSSQAAAEFLGWKVEKVYSDYYRSQRRLRDMLLEYGEERVLVWRGRRPEDLSV